MRTGIGSTPRQEQLWARRRTGPSPPRRRTSRRGARSTSRAARAGTRCGSRSAAGTSSAVDFSEVAIATRARARRARRRRRRLSRASTSSTSSPTPGAFDLVLVLFLQLPADERRLVLEPRRASARARRDVPAGRPRSHEPDRRRRRPERPRPSLHARRHRRRAPRARDREGGARAARRRRRRPACDRRARPSAPTLAEVALASNGPSASRRRNAENCPAFPTPTSVSPCWTTSPGCAPLTGSGSRRIAITVTPVRARKRASASVGRSPGSCRAPGSTRCAARRVPSRAPRRSSAARTRRR